jgi:two-component system, LuxR family, sensor kinase FixL
MRKPVLTGFLAMLSVTTALPASLSTPQQDVRVNHSSERSNFDTLRIHEALPPNLRIDKDLGLSESRTPQRTLFLLLAPTTWRQYKVYILLGVAVLVLQMALIISLVAQIDRRKRTERAIREREEQFRQFASTAPVLVWMSSADKVCTLFNRFWLDFSGRSMDIALGNGWAEGVHPEDTQNCMDVYMQAFGRREEFSTEYRLRRRDGEYRWVLDTGVPRFNPDLSFAGYIGACIDVTERKRVAQELRAKEERNKQIARFYSVAMVVNQGVTEKNVLFNEGFTTMFGYTKEDVPDIDRWWRMAYPDENYRTEIKIKWQERVEEADGNHAEIDLMEARVRCKDGSTRDIEFHFSCLGDTKVVSFVDLTEWKRTESNGAGKLEGISHMDWAASSGQMAFLAHELAQPLAAILSNAQAAERFASRSAPDLDEIRGALADITEDDRRARAVVDNMRGMFQKHKITTREMDLNQLVNNVHRLVKSDALMRGVQLQLMLFPSAVQVWGQESMLQQVLLNLISNGLDAMKDIPKARKVLTITTAVQKRANCGTIVVEDSGKGVAEEEKQKLFTPFFTTKTDGLGMGLSISRSLIESLGGRITLEDRSAPGAAFRVELPLAPVAAIRNC